MEKDKKDEFVEKRKKRSLYPRSLFPDIQPAEIVPLTFLKQHARLIMGATLIFSDVVSLFVSFYLAITFYGLLVKQVTVSLYVDLIIFVVIFIFLYAWHGLYPAVGLNPVDEIKKLLNATSSGFLILLAVTFFEKRSATYSRAIFGSAWIISLVLVQFNRWILRIIGRGFKFWGEPVAVVGNGPIGRGVENHLRKNIHFGMYPHLLLSGKADVDMKTMSSINCSKIATVILIPSEMDKKLLQQFIYEQRFGRHRRKGEREISRLILVSELSWISSLGIGTHDLNGLLGLEVRQNLLNKGAKLLKRSIDLFITSIALIFLAPFIPFVLLAIRIDSPGPIFYFQKRVGKEGKEFCMWKFRTMVKNADQILEQYLEESPELKAEWESSRKLKFDPRITRVGRFLRKWSIDELPQLWNVFIGEMSLVGPRPIVEGEIKYYKNVYRLYRQVSPGITGMWQISGRTDTSYTERINFDEYYIRNWSVWLDIYILVRTVWIVLNKEGAY